MAPFGPIGTSTAISRHCSSIGQPDMTGIWAAAGMVDEYPVVAYATRGSEPTRKELQE